MLLSVLYVAVQRTLQFLFLRFRSTASKDVEIVSFATSWRYCVVRSGGRRFVRPTG